MKTHQSIKDLKKEDRPQERLEKHGPGPLTDRELLAMLIRSGTANYDVLAIADEIIKQQADKSNSEIANLKTQLEQIKINDSLLSSASKHKANVPDQVVQLLKSNVKLNDEGKVEILAENQQPRYNTKGELLSVDEYVQEFLTQNPHFQSATPSGSGSVANVGKVNAKPFNIADLDMTNPDDRKRYAEYKKERDGKPSVINLK